MNFFVFIAFIVFAFSVWAAESTHTKPDYLTLADRFADTSSDGFDINEARKNYFRAYMSDFKYLSIPENCKKVFSNIPDGLVDNKIHAGVILEFSGFCGMAASELFSIAEDFENDGGRYIQDELVALFIYEHISFMLLMDNDGALEEIVKERISSLK